MFLIGIKGLFMLFIFGVVIFGFWKYAHHTILTENKNQELEDAKIKADNVIKTASKIKEVNDSTLVKAKDKIKRTIKKGDV